MGKVSGSGQNRRIQGKERVVIDEVGEAEQGRPSKFFKLQKRLSTKEVRVYRTWSPLFSAEFLKVCGDECGAGKQAR